MAAGEPFRTLTAEYALNRGTNCLGSNPNDPTEDTEAHPTPRASSIPMLPPTQDPHYTLARAAGPYP